MIGIPGQSYETLADDILLFAHAGPRHDRRRPLHRPPATRRWDRSGCADGPGGEQIPRATS